MSEPIQVVDLDSAEAWTLRSAGRVREQLASPASRRLLLVTHLSELAAVLSGPRQRGSRNHRLLLLGHPRRVPWALLQASFGLIVGVEPGLRLLPTDELREVLEAPHRVDLFIGGKVYLDHKTMVLYRGNLDPLAVPLSLFRPSGDGIVPDFERFSVRDHGQTVRLGRYEASSGAILYELDPSYRRRANARRWHHDGSFGGCLRRLRLQKRVRREDFPGLTARTIARIERGEVSRPHPATLAKISQRLGVRPEEIESF